MPERWELPNFGRDAGDQRPREVSYFVPNWLFLFPVLALVFIAAAVVLAVLWLLLVVALAIAIVAGLVRFLVPVLIEKWQEFRQPDVYGDQPMPPLPQPRDQS